MKILSTIILSAVLGVFTGNIFAQDTAFVLKENEVYYGTWVNMDYQPNAHPRQKIINYPGEWAMYGSPESETTPETGTYSHSTYIFYFQDLSYGFKKQMKLILL